MTESSMPLQKSVHVCGQLPANSFGRRNLFNTRSPEAIHGPEPPQ